jgi:hypothetical protein
VWFNALIRVISQYFTYYDNSLKATAQRPIDNFLHKTMQAGYYSQPGEAVPKPKIKKSGNDVIRKKGCRASI